MKGTASSLVVTLVLFSLSNAHIFCVRMTGKISVGGFSRSQRPQLGNRRAIVRHHPEAVLVPNHERPALLDADGVLTDEFDGEAGRHGSGDHRPDRPVVLEDVIVLRR